MYVYTVRTNKQHICFKDLRRSICDFAIWNYENWPYVSVMRYNRNGSQYMTLWLYWLSMYLCGCALVMHAFSLSQAAASYKSSQRSQQHNILRKRSTLRPSQPSESRDKMNRNGSRFPSPYETYIIYIYIYIYICIHIGVYIYTHIYMHI